MMNVVRRHDSGPKGICQNPLLTSNLRHRTNGVRGFLGTHKYAQPQTFSSLPPCQHTRGWDLRYDPQGFHALELTLHLLAQRKGDPPGCVQGEWLCIFSQLNLVGVSQSLKALEQVGELLAYLVLGVCQVEALNQFQPLDG